MIIRHMQKALTKAAKGFPVLTITGPRQSGKTTLAKMTFPDYEYFNLENPEVLHKAQSDPRIMFKNLENGIIFDEIQKCPELLSWAQVFIDETNSVGKLILTGSNQFEYMKNIGQSLAGRSAMFKLLPFSLEEIDTFNNNSWEYYACKGFYPRLYNNEIETQLFYSSYVATYLERDIRALMQIRNLREFEKFIGLCAGRTGSILNISSLATECGVDQKTIQAWISLLEASFIIYLLKPYHANLNKRLVKSPKLYFYDPGLASYLLGIRNEKDLQNHPLRGSVFETIIVAETVKHYFNRGLVPPITFYRDAKEHEIDLIVSGGTNIFPLEIKSGTTINKDYFKNITYLRKVMDKDLKAGLIFADKRRDEINHTIIQGWDKVSEMLSEID